MKKTPIKEIIAELGLPDNAEFIGYGIHLVESDEFMFSYEETEEVQNIGWIGTPEKAKAFQSQKKAEKIKANFKPEANVVWMFDIGKQIYVAKLDGY